MDKEFNSEYLRPLEFVNESDSRNRCFSVLDPAIKNIRPLEIKDYHSSISKYQLNENVPENIRIQFETVKNLFLYSWFVYRFHSVSELCAFTCLELALRTRYGKEIPKKYYPRSKEPTLRPLLNYAIDKEDIRNEGFQVWHNAVLKNAKNRSDMEKIDEFIASGLPEMEIDEAEPKIMEVDKNYDYINIIKETIPMLRNNYSHGTSMLHNQVLGSIQIVSEIINQAYE